ncbi:hypothetical protein Tco_0992008 [Tanacetum coccineum]|uniref:Uncharacterized protein n=1 Tax=Tanacetum coccineum TaxID=301880 RepID=A0ABQ5F1A4_9ASTR
MGAPVQPKIRLFLWKAVRVYAGQANSPNGPHKAQANHSSPNSSMFSVETIEHVLFENSLASPSLVLAPLCAFQPKLQFSLASLGGCVPMVVRMNVNCDAALSRILCSFVIIVRDSSRLPSVLSLVIVATPYLLFIAEIIRGAFSACSLAY